MSESLAALIGQYGAWVIFAATFLSCLALPIPSSLMMLTGGAFIASGDLAALPALIGAWSGAVLGDQAAFQIGRYGGRPLVEWLAQSPRRQAALARARTLSERHGGPGVFFSRWLVAPLGPWVNFITGATGLGWRRFSLWDMAGETIWVGLYFGAGYAFARNLDAVIAMAGNIAGLVGALVVAIAMGLWIRGALRQEHARARAAAAARKLATRLRPGTRR